MPATELIAAATEGFLLGAGLIVAIGPQNAFVLRQGLARQHALAVATVCALADAVLIAAGVGGAGALVQAAPALMKAVTLGGAVFLAAYGLLAFRRAVRPAALAPAGDSTLTLGTAIATCLALTFLNPHVYLDTVALIGALSARHERSAALAFGAGAAVASMAWFFGLALAAGVAAPLFARPEAWRILDVLIGLIMLTIALRLAGEAMAMA
jgi:L-lysine exporter family protein LysE/ArgO